MGDSDSRPTTVPPRYQIPMVVVPWSTRFVLVSITY